MKKCVNNMGEIKKPNIQKNKKEKKTSFVH